MQVPNEAHHIINPDRNRQVIDYTGLLPQNDPAKVLLPTDIDGLIDWKNRGYIFIELKYHDAMLSLGQKLALERLVKDANKVHKHALAILARHQVTDTDKYVFANESDVDIIYDGNINDWFKLGYDIKLGDFIRKTLYHWDVLDGANYERH